MDPLDASFALLVGLLGFLFRLALAAPFLYGFYFLMTLPWRRRERAALVLDLLELGQRDGRSPAETIASLSDLPDRRLPARLHLLAAHLQNGLSLDDALERIPHLLPPAIRSMLQVGLRHGQPDRALAVCRQALIPPLGRTQGAVIYLALLASLTWLTAIPLLVMFRVVVLPKFRQVAADLAGAPWEGSWQNDALNLSAWMLGLTVVIGFVLQLGLFGHVGGPRALGIRHWLDRLRLVVPWQRDRTHRDFAAMLGLLLDAGVTESVAVQEAGRATGNIILELRAQEVARRLKQGETLPRAIGELDSAGEFRWRLENAHHGSLSRTGPRFTETLRGWLASLEARALQRETNAVQAVICGLILSFGAAVGLHCAGTFGWLVSIVEASL